MKFLRRLGVGSWWADAIDSRYEQPHPRIASIDPNTEIARYGDGWVIR